MVRRSSVNKAKTAEEPTIRQLDWQLPYNPYPFTTILSDDQIEAIHQASLTILEDIGIHFLLEEARDIIKAAGGETKKGDDLVKFDRGLVMEAIAHTPSQFTVHARNPKHNIKIGGRHMAYALVGSPPNVSDIEKGRRRGNVQDYCDLLKLGQYFNCCHIIGGYPVEPIDLAPSIRHLEALRHMTVLSDKTFHAYSLGRERILDGLEIARIVRNLDWETFKTQPSLFSIINTSSPLRIDRPMLQGIIEMSKASQVLVITPFTLSGAMAPVTIAGALAQQNAEALAGIAFTQLVNKGAPVIYGGFTSNVDMRTGAPAFGTPEYAKAAIAGGQLARRYNIPYRTSNVNASNAPDAQAAWESMMSLWPALTSGGHMIKHALGWIEGGLCASFEKIIMDVELLQMMMEFFKPLEINDESLALSAVRDVGPGGHFFGCDHTMQRYRNAFYEPLLADWNNFENWEDQGAKTATKRAHHLYKKALLDYKKPAMDQSVREELDDFVNRRVREGGVKEH
ncbi:MAG: trimethylamine methyltransferase family protein [Pseudomonadota bacterium]